MKENIGSCLCSLGDGEVTMFNIVNENLNESYLSI